MGILFFLLTIINHNYTRNKETSPMNEIPALSTCVGSSQADLETTPVYRKALNTPLATRVSASALGLASVLNTRSTQDSRVRFRPSTNCLFALITNPPYQPAPAPGRLHLHTHPDRAPRQRAAGRGAQLYGK